MCSGRAGALLNWQTVNLDQRYHAHLRHCLNRVMRLPTSAFGRITFHWDISKSSPGTFHRVGGAQIRRVGR
jgi:hypothetical protein